MSKLYAYVGPTIPNKDIDLMKAFREAGVMVVFPRPWRMSDCPSPLTFFCFLSNLKEMNSISLEDGEKVIKNPLFESGLTKSNSIIAKIKGTDFKRSEVSLIDEDFRSCWHYQEAVKFNEQFYAIRLIIIDDEPLPGTKEEEVQNIIKDAEQAAADKMNAETMREIEKNRIERENKINNDFERMFGGKDTFNIYDGTTDIKLKILEDRLKKFTSKTDDTKKSSMQAATEAIRSIVAATSMFGKALGIK